VIPIARRWIWRIDVVHGVGFQRKRPEPGSRLEGDHEDARQGGIFGRRSLRGRWNQWRVRCPRATRPLTGCGRGGQGRAVDARLAGATLVLGVPGIGDVAAAACRCDIGQRQRGNEHQERQAAPPADSIDHARPLEQHDIGSGLGRRVDPHHSYRRYARIARTVRRRCDWGVGSMAAQSERVVVTVPFRSAA
jgi:hypothetical protein